MIISRQSYYTAVLKLNRSYPSLYYAFETLLQTPTKCQFQAHSINLGILCYRLILSRVFLKNVLFLFLSSLLSHNLTPHSLCLHLPSIISCQSAGAHVGITDESLWMWSYRPHVATRRTASCRRFFYLHSIGTAITVE